MRKKKFCEHLHRLRIPIHQNRGFDCIKVKDLKEKISKEKLESFEFLFGSNAMEKSYFFASDVEVTLDRVFKGE